MRSTLSCNLCRSPHPPVKEDVKRLVFTSGKVYYELAAKRAEMEAQQDIAIVRVEQVLAVLIAYQPQQLEVRPRVIAHAKPLSKDTGQAFGGVILLMPKLRLWRK